MLPYLPLFTFEAQKSIDRSENALPPINKALLHLPLFLGGEVVLIWDGTPPIGGGPWNMKTEVMSLDPWEATVGGVAKISLRVFHVRWRQKRKRFQQEWRRCHCVKEKDVSTCWRPVADFWRLQTWIFRFSFNKTYFFGFFSAECLHLLFFLILKHQFRRLTCVTGSSNLGLTITTFQGSKWR